jgi:uncharacterized OB-fold protein
MTQLPQSTSSPLPLIDSGSAPHWEGLARGALVLRRCDVCTAVNHPAAGDCRVCESPQLTWSEVSPIVRLYSWAVEERSVIAGMVPPYVIAQVTPSECADGDVRVVGTVLADASALTIGMSLQLRPETAPGSDIALATFVPV